MITTDKGTLPRNFSLVRNNAGSRSTPRTVISTAPQSRAARA
ncbi:Uncharacterised protein [Mycobacteroides abscessus subsp. abscessus]|nr:Uncharacterised protein [Mycobacteroides abscessus subsp. abscessus]